MKLSQILGSLTPAIFAAAAACGFASVKFPKLEIVAYVLALSALVLIGVGLSLFLFGF